MWVESLIKTRSTANGKHSLLFHRITSEIEVNGKLCLYIQECKQYTPFHLQRKKLVLNFTIKINAVLAIFRLRFFSLKFRDKNNAMEA